MNNGEVRTGMTEILPSEEQMRMIQIYKAIMAQVFVRYTPKAERVKWLMPSDDVSEWTVDEQKWIKVYRRGEEVKVEVKYYALPWEDMCKDQIDFALTKVLIEASRVITLDVLFESLMEISMNIYRLMTKYAVPVIVKDMRNFMTSFIVDFDEMKMFDLSTEVIFHDSSAFTSRENLCVSTISIEETDQKKLEAGKEWRALTLVNCTGGLEPGKTDWPPEDYIILRDKYAKEEIGKDFNIEEYHAKREACEELNTKEILVANAEHSVAAHEFCMAKLRGEI